MKLCSSAISVGWMAVPPPEITFPSSSSPYFSREFKSTSPPLSLVGNRFVILHQTMSSFVVKQSSSSPASAIETTEGTTEPTIKDKRVSASLPLPLPSLFKSFNGESWAMGNPYEKRVPPPKGDKTRGKSRGRLTHYLKFILQLTVYQIGEDEYTLDEALSRIGFGKFQFMVLAYAGLGWVAEAMEMMLLSFVGPALQPEWGLSSSQESFISTIAFVGMLIGAYLWGVISDTYGRKKGFLGASIITSGAGLLSALAPNYTSLLLLRFFIGVGLGCGHVFTSWFLEFVPTPKRGTWMVVFATFWTVGTILEASLAWLIMPNFGWRWLLGLSAVPSLLVLLFYNRIPESPRYLCSNQRLIETRYILEKGAVLNQKELPVGMLVSDQVNKAENEGDSMALETSSSSISMLLSPKLIRTTLPLWFLYFGNTFTYYGVVLLTSQLSISPSECGVVALQSDTIPDSSIYTNVLITSLAELPGLGLAASILDRLGRKISMEIMFLAGFVLLLPLVVHQNEIMTTTFLFGARMFVSASFIIACIYAPEVYPTNLRATGVGIATAVGRTGGMVCPLVAVGLVNSCNQTLAVVLFEAMILVSGLSVALLPFETKGRELK